MHLSRRLRDMTSSFGSRSMKCSRDGVWKVDVGRKNGCRGARRGHRRRINGLCRARARDVGRSGRPARAGQRDLLRQCRHHQQRLDIAAQQSVAVEGAAEIPDQPPRRIALESGLGNSKRGMGRALSGRFGRVAFQAAGDRAAWVDRRIGKTAPGMDRESGSRASHSRDRLAQGVAERCGRGGEAGAGPPGRIRHRQRIARPPGHLRARA